MVAPTAKRMVAMPAIYGSRIWPTAREKVEKWWVYKVRRLNELYNGELLQRKATVDRLSLGQLVPAEPQRRDLLPRRYFEKVA